MILACTESPFPLTHADQCCTQFKSPGVKIFFVLYLHYNVAFRDIYVIWKFLTQNVLFPQGLNWVQH